MSKKNNHTTARSGLIAALDVGTTKVCCLIAQIGEERGSYEKLAPKVIGIGHHVSTGMRAGTVVDLHDVETSIRTTVEAAEQMAGKNIDKVVVNISGGRPVSSLVSYEVSIAGHEIGEADLRRVLAAANREENMPVDSDLIHTIPIGYCIDGNRGVRDPRGMYGETLSVNMHMVSAKSGPVRNLETSISRCHLEIENMVVTPLASSMACLVDDEKKMGVTCIDVGGETTSFAVFFDGELIHTGMIPLGGVHITNDIARGLTTPLVHAERMKTLYGSAIPSINDDREIINIPVVGEDDGAEGNQVPRSMLVSIIRPRVEEIFEMVQERLETAGFHNAMGHQVVLTGGTSQLPGICDLASQILQKQVRLGRPNAVSGLAEAVAGPAFSACVGLLHYASNHQSNVTGAAYQPGNAPMGRLARIGQWLRENF